MQTVVKLTIALAIILICTQIGKRFSSLAGLIAVMPLTGLLIFVWLYFDSSGDPGVMIPFTRGLLWGIVPTVLFFITVLVCLQKGLPLPVLLSLGFGVWLIGALIHQVLLR